jgi:hypothetical protein
MTVEDSIKKAMARMIERVQDIKDVEVTSWEEEYDVYVYSSGCSCNDYDKEFSVSVYYTTPDKVKGSYSYPGTFAELIRELDR